MPTNILDTGANNPKMNVEMTYLKKNSIEEDICQKLRNKDFYGTKMHKIYNLIVGNTN